MSILLILTLHIQLQNKIYSSGGQDTVKHEKDSPVVHDRKPAHLKTHIHSAVMKQQS